MPKPKATARFVLALIMALTVSACQGGLGEALNQTARQLGSGSSPSRNKIADGLKEALRVGTENAVAATSRLNGYYRNPQIRIPLPENIRKAERLIRLAGLGAQVDAFEKSMNRAAEQAAPEARTLFVSAIRQMTFADAKQILGGRENEATLYFKRKTYQPLEQRFQPLVHRAMAEVGVTRSYQKVARAVRSLPVGGLVDVDLDHYVTGKALDGLFFMLAQEEARIRRDPAARVTQLLQQVFGGSR